MASFVSGMPSGFAVRLKVKDIEGRNRKTARSVQMTWLVVRDDLCRFCSPGAVASAVALMACAGAPPAGPAAQTSSQPALARTMAVIPAAVQQVTLSMNYGGNANGRKPPAPVTITDSAKVSEVAGLVADQPPWPPGTYSCPASDGMALILTFRALPGRPALATAVLALNGCEGTDLTVGTKAVALGDPDSARSLAAKVLEVAGVPWKLPPFQWPPG